jgi:hypothetical protein
MRWILMRLRNWWRGLGRCEFDLKLPDQAFKTGSCSPDTSRQRQNSAFGLLAHMAQPVTQKRVALAEHQYLQMCYASKLGR